MLELAEKSVKKNLKVGVGLMSRHSRHMQQLHQRIQDGEITQEEADTEIAQAFWWTAISELQGAEYCDAPFAAKLREFVSIRQILVS